MTCSNQDFADIVVLIGDAHEMWNIVLWEGLMHVYVEAGGKAGRSF